MTKREKFIFDRLEDALSKKVFSARKNVIRYYPIDWSQKESRVIEVPELSALYKNPQHMEAQGAMERFAFDDKKFVLYGAGGDAKIFVAQLSLLNPQRIGDCVGLWDINPLIHGKDVLEIGIAVTPPRANIRIAENTDFDVLVTVRSSLLLYDIVEFLSELGFEDERILTFNYRLAEVANFAAFDKFKYGGEEIFVDGGCLNFNSSYEFLQACPQAKKIYAFEPNQRQLATIKKYIDKVGFKNIDLVNAALLS